MAFRVAALALACAVPAFAAAPPVASNTEMAEIFKADQADRGVRSVDWKVVRLADENRRARTEQLLDEGMLRSGDDLYDASFIFQHGNAPNDFLKAHLLAIMATAKGKPDATWIAAATLDRYLQAIGKPQVFGTQFTRADDGKFTQEPYDRSVASDAMRKVMRVPTMAEQEADRQKYEASAERSTPPK